MSEKTIEIEAETLEEAREQVKSQIPEGLHLLSEQVICDGKPKTVNAVADTMESAFAKAHSDIPTNATILEKKELSTPAQRVITVQAFDERGAASEARQQLGDATLVKSLKLTVAGKKGFFGIRKTPNQYEAEVFQQAVVTIIYKQKAQIRARIGEEPEDPNIYGGELKGLRDLLRRQNGILHCLQCNSNVQINLKTIESEIRRNREIEAGQLLGGTLVLFHPDISQGTVCKNCKGVVCGKCSHDALSRKMEFRSHLEPLIRKHFLRQLGVLALLNPGVVEETIRTTMPLVLSPADESTILCLKCKQELLMGIDHITD